MTTKIKISLTEGISWVIEQLEGYAIGLIPTEDKLEILTTRMEGKVRSMRSEYQTALSAVVEIEDPTHPTEGTLPKLREKLVRREAQGKAWGEELAAVPDTARTKRLQDLLETCDQECTRIEGEISSAEMLLATRKETCGLRKSSYDAARKDLQRLKDVAPSVLAQISAMQDADRERLEAMAASGKPADSQPGALINQITAELEQAKAHHTATGIMVADEAEEEPDLDQIEAQEAAARHTSERISRWMGKTPTTADTTN